MSTPAEILIVDDESGERASLSAVLNEAGYTVSTTDSVEAALDALDASEFDAVLCDLRLGDGANFELLAELERRDSEVPVIVVSGIGGKEDVLRALRMGAVDYVSKPVDPEVMLHATARAVERLRLVRQNRDYEQRLEAANRRMEEHIKELERDERAGRRVQLGMLPPSPMQIANYRLCYRILPSLFLSGDFVDYFTVTDRHFCFYIADVSGHGASSAFITVLLKNFSRRLRREYKLRMLTRPGMVLSWVNRELLDNHLDKHVTLFIGMVHTRTNMLYFANAGHFPHPLVVRGEREVVSLDIRGKPLGLFEDIEYESGSIDLGERSTVLAFTDGVLEVMPESSLAEKERRLKEVAAICGNDPDAVAAELGLREGLQAPDDIAYVIVSSV